jgi:hypothetical protein
MWEIFVHGLVFYYCIISITVVTNAEKLQIRVNISLLSAFPKSIKAEKLIREGKGAFNSKSFQKENPDLTNSLKGCDL